MQIEVHTRNFISLVSTRYGPYPANACLLLPPRQDLEISFSPEIGDATVGSLVVCTSKDSSIDGPGYLSALVAEVTYVDEVGTADAACRERSAGDRSSSSSSSSCVLASASESMPRLCYKIACFHL
jgi:hypothetical protein